MPQRILRDLTDSEHYNNARVHVRDLFIRLLNKADDFGLFFADSRHCRPLLYPLLLDEVREADLKRLISDCEKAGLVRLYAVDGREYLQIRRWGYQRMRNIKAKFPAPPWGYAPHPDDIAHAIRTADAPRPRSDTDSDSDSPQPPERGARGNRLKKPEETAIKAAEIARKRLAEMAGKT